MTDTDITKRLADWTVGLRPGDIPTAVRREGVRTFVNWLGCALGGARHETVDRAIEALAPFSGHRAGAVLGRAERLDELYAALMNGISSHVLDYDDTHLKTIIHPAGPVASAILAVAEARARHGRGVPGGAGGGRRGRVPARQLRSTPSTTTGAGTSPEQRASSARLLRWGGSCASMSGR